MVSQEQTVFEKTAAASSAENNDFICTVCTNFVYFCTPVSRVFVAEEYFGM